MASSPDPIIAAFEELYERHGGDCIAIFAELDEEPAKALANAPKSAREFALRYIKGDYAATETNPLRHPSEELRLAILHGNLRGVKAALARGADPDSYKDKHGRTALMDMCFFSLSTSTSTEVVSVLLDSQANPNVAMGDGETALMRASKIDGIGGTGGYGGPAVVPLLLNAGADPNAQTKDGTTALMGATASVIPILLAARGDPNSRDSAGATALIHGASNRRAASLLLAAGADPNAHTGSGTTALMCADGSVVPLLLAAAADPNARDNTGKTALSIAAHSCSAVVVSLLLAARSDPRSVLDGADVSAALLKAAREGNDAMTMALLAAGADPAASDGISALAYAEKPLESTLARASGTDWQTLKEDWLDANHGKSECVRLLKAAILKRRETLEVLIAVMLACARLAPMDTANAGCNPFAASLASLPSRPLQMIADAVAALGWDANCPH